MDFIAYEKRSFTFMIDYGDGSNINMKSVTTNSPPYFVGIEVPKTLSEPIITDTDTSTNPHNYNFFLYNIEFKHEAILKGFEIYAHTGGGYYLSIFDPCNNTYVSCLQNGKTHQTYLEKKRWIPSPSQLLVEGYNYIPVEDFNVSKSWMVYIYLGPGPTKIAWNIRNIAPRSDYATKGYSSLNQRLHSNQNWALFVRAQVDRYEHSMEIEHTFKIPGTYKVSAYEVSNRNINSNVFIDVV